MNTKQQTDQLVKLVKCESCMKEVPASGAKNAETADYVAHFCGLACFDTWRKQTEKR